MGYSLRLEGKRVVSVQADRRPRERHPRLPGFNPRHPAGPAFFSSSPGFLFRITRVPARLALAAVLLFAFAGGISAFAHAQEFATGSNAVEHTLTCTQEDPAKSTAASGPTDVPGVAATPGNLQTTPFDSDVSEDFNTLHDAGNHHPSDIWSNGTTMWVADPDDTKIYAYKMSDKSRDPAKDFNTLDNAGNNFPSDIWSDGTTMWVADPDDTKIYAYNLSTKAWEADKDFDTLYDASNYDPCYNYNLSGIWSDGTTMWMLDPNDDKIYAYNLSTKARETEKDFDTLDDAGNYRPSGIWSDGITMWVADWSDRKIYSYRMSDKSRTNCAPTAAPCAHDADKDFNTLYDADNYHPFDNYSPSGIWSDRTTMWVADWWNEKIYAYRMSDKSRDDARDFNTLSEDGNSHPTDIWSDGITMWVLDSSDDKIYAYKMSNKSRDPDKDFPADTLHAAGNSVAGGIWSDGTTMWISDYRKDKIYAYRMNDKSRDPDKDFPADTLRTAGNARPVSLWSDGTTMWVADNLGAKIYAYRMSDKSRDDARDFNTLDDAGNYNPLALWSDGTTMWVADYSDSKIYAYNMPTPPGVMSTEREELPEEIALAGNYPNPFNPVTTVTYALPRTNNVRLAVYDLLGREVAVLIDGPKAAGRHAARFDAGNVPSGTYIYRLQAENKNIVRTMILVK